MLEQINVKDIIAIAQQAGKAILEIYNQPIKVEYKDDKSPLTAADKASNDVINEGLQRLYPQIPILSEENREVAFEERKDWDCFWLVDPLDGTKEFIKRNGEFTVNIALIKDGKPVLGVVDLPVKSETYYASTLIGAHKIIDGNSKEINTIKPTKEKLIVMASRSHLNEDTQAFIDEQKKYFDAVDFISAGSSLKLCFVAEGKAHMYPRYAPTMEWDTGAGQAVAECAGASVTQAGTNKALEYNKENLLNPYFLVSA